MPELIKSSAGQLSSDIGVLFAQDEIVVRNGTTGTNFAAGDFVLFDIGRVGGIADTNIEGLDTSVWSCVVTPDEQSKNHLSFCPGAVLLEDIPASAGGLVSKGRAMLRGVVNATVSATVSLVAGSAGDKLVGIAASTSLDAINPGTTGSGANANQKFYGLLAGDMATTGPESVQIMFDGVTGFR